MRVLDLGVISNNERFRRRAELVARFFDFEFRLFNNDEDFFSNSGDYKGISCVVLDCSELTKPNEVAGQVQVAKQAAPESYILTVVSSKLSPEDARIVKTSGASLVIMENEYFSSSKPEFILSQVIRSTYFPIKALDLVQGSEVSFPIFHLLSVNKRFLKVAKPGYKVGKDFLEKYADVGDLYLQRSDLPAWVQYTNLHSTEGAESHLRKCRLRFLQLNQSFLNLILLITDQSSAASFAQGRELFEVCEGFASDLLDSMADLPDPWSVISNSAIGDFGSVERAPAIAAYAGILSSQARMGNPKEVMIGALLADIGFLDLSPSTTEKVRQNRLNDLNAEEKMEYQKHPIYSLNQCLSRKLPLSEDIKEIIIQSHERMDQRGFPHHVRSDKLNEAGMLVRLCWDLDMRCQVRMGEKRVDIKEVKQKLSESATNDTGNYSFIFLNKILKLLNKPENNGEVIVV